MDHALSHTSLTHPAQLTTGVKNCARCGRDHVLIVFIAFARPIIEQNGTVWAFWGTCPDTLAPILLRVEEDENKDVQFTDAPA